MKALEHPPCRRYTPKLCKGYLEITDMIRHKNKKGLGNFELVNELKWFISVRLSNNPDKMDYRYIEKAREWIKELEGTK